MHNSLPPTTRSRKKASTRVQRKPLALSDIEQAFVSRMEPVRTTFGYSVSLILVSLLMILLPVLYLGLVFSIGYYGYESYVAADGFTFGAGIAIFLVFMLTKPILIRERNSYKPLCITKEEEPIFFAYISKICETVEAPTPKRIFISCELNAGAAFHRGFFSFFNKDMDLLIGLPLIVGLDTRQLTGVLAHEFGHFSQGFGMRAGYVIQRVNYWFAKVVYQRDVFDYWLSRIGNIASFIMFFVHLIVWISRFVLWMFMHIAHLSSSFLSRQMEFNADRHAMNVTGNNDFIGTLKFMPIIEVSLDGALGNLHQAWRERKLGDNMPALVYNNIKRISSDKKQRIMTLGMEQNASLYDSHPSTNDRLFKSKSLISNGITKLERRPAVDLFQHFEDICKRVTLAMYTEGYEIDVKPNMLIETTQLIADVEQEEARTHAYNRYFQAQWGYHPIFPISEYKAIDSNNLSELERLIGKQHNSFSNGTEQLAELGKQLDEIDNHINNLHQATLLKQSGFEFDPEKLHIQSSTKNGINRGLKKAEEEHRALCASLQPFEDSLTERINITQHILSMPIADDLIEDHNEALETFMHARSSLQLIYPQIELITHLRYQWCALQGILQFYDAQIDNPDYRKTMVEHLNDMHDSLTHINMACQDISYPLEHTHGDISLSHYLIEKLPELNDLDGLYACSEECIGNYMVLYHRLLGIIAITCEAMEEACGLPHLLDPVSDEMFPD